MDRFWSKVDRPTPDGCWIWTAARTEHEYGVFAPDWRRTKKAHRVSWERFIGPIPNGLWVLHRCDNPPCVNPSHLFLGTRADNIQDMMQKGRAPYGEKAFGAKLDESDVYRIRSLAAFGETQLAISRRFGISRPQVAKIVQRRRWPHLPEVPK